MKQTQTPAWSSDALAGQTYSNTSPRAFERLGLIVGSVLAASGVLLFFGFAKDDGMSVFVHALKEFHELWGRQ